MGAGHRDCDLIFRTLLFDGQLTRRFTLRLCVVLVCLLKIVWVCVGVCACVWLFLYLLAWLCVCLSICLSIHPYVIYLSASPSACLLVFVGCMCSRYLQWVLSKDMVYSW